MFIHSCNSFQCILILSSGCWPQLLPLCSALSLLYEYSSPYTSVFIHSCNSFQCILILSSGYWPQLLLLCSALSLLYEYSSPYTSVFIHSCNSFQWFNSFLYRLPDVGFTYCRFVQHFLFIFFKKDAVPLIYKSLFIVAL